MAIPKEPRQLMINMMYIVLTALLALNVSAEVLNAFKLVSLGMETSNEALDDKNGDLMFEFDKQSNINEQKTKPFYDDAKRAKELYDEFDTYIQSLTANLVEASGGWLPDEEGNKSNNLKNKKNYSDPTRIMIDQKKGDELEAKINELRTNLLALPKLTQQDRDDLENQFTLSTDYDKDAAKKLDKKSWAAYHFDHVPIIAVQTLMTKMKGDGKASYGLVVEKLLAKISAEDYKFDALRTTVIPNTTYVLQGQDFNAAVYMSAYSTTQDPEIFVGKFKSSLRGELYNKEGQLIGTKRESNPLDAGFTKVDVNGGIGMIKEKGTRLGEVTKQGVIKVRKPNSQTEFVFYPFEQKYQVAAGGVVVSPEKMNVMYIGVDNPMAISAAGFPNEKVKASMSQGSLKANGNGKYTAKVTKQGKATVSVSAQVDGKMKQLGTAEFRVKPVPDPVAKVGNSKGGATKTSTFKVQRGLIAALENFDFDVRFNIVSFMMTYSAARQDLVDARTTGPLFDSKMQGFIKRSKPGDIFYFDEIRAKGPDGTTRKLPSIVFKLI